MFTQKIKNFTQKIKNFNKTYAEYLICITFMNLIIIKINNVFFNVSSVYLYVLIITISIIFLQKIIFIINKIKNTYIFNYILYYFLFLKNNMYKIIFKYFDYIEHIKYSKILLFLTGFVLSSWTLNLFFLIINNSYDLSISVFFFLLIFSIFNLIENKIIFTPENIAEKSQIDYNIIKTFLKIDNQSFKKNNSLFYIQKRYVSVNEIKSLIKKYGATIITSATAGSLFSGYLQHSSVKIQKKQLEFYKLQHKENMEFQKIKYKHDILTKYDERIGSLNKEITGLKAEMNSYNFWNTPPIYLSESIKELEYEKELLKKRRASFDSSELNFNNSTDNDNFLLED